MVRQKLLLAIFLPFLLLHSNHLLVSISATKFDLDRPSSASSASSTFLRERLQRLASGDAFSGSPLSTHSLLENRQEDQAEQLVNRRRLHTCQHHCSISDPKALPCWNETLHFYEEIIVGLLRRTIRVETNRAIWMLANQPPIASSAHIDFGRLADDSRRRLKQLPLGQRVHDDNDWKTAEPVLDSLSTALAQNAQSVMGKLTRDHYGSQFPQLETECPHGCERAWDSWKLLFVGSLLVSMLLLGLLFFLVFLLDKRAQSAWNEEAEEFGTTAGSVGMGMGKKSSVAQQQQQDQMLRTFRVVR